MGNQRLALPIVLGLVIAASVLILAALPVQALWITDCNNKYLVAVNAAAKHFRDFSIDYPGLRLDPELAAKPIVEPFAVVRGGKLYSQYPPLFAHLSAYLFAWFGWYGLFVIPVGGAVASLWLIDGLARDAGLTRANALACALTLFWCTPCLFYTFCFWEHTLAIAWLLASLRLLGRAYAGGAPSLIATSGALLGLGVAVREEFTLIAAALFIPIVGNAAMRRVAAPRFALGVVAGLAPVGLYQQWAVGSAFGFHLTSNLRTSAAWNAGGTKPILVERWQVASQLLGNVSVNGVVTAVVILAVVGVCLLAARSSRPNRGTAVALYAGIGCVTVFSLAVFVASPNPIDAFARGNGLLMHAALLVPAFTPYACRGDSASSRFLRMLRNGALLYIVLLCLTAPPISAQGIHWGPRLLLPIYPMLLLPAWAGVQVALDAARAHRDGGSARPRRTGLIAAFAFALVACAILQLYSLSVLKAKLEGTVGMQTALLAAPEEVVVTNRWWFPQEMAGVFYEKTFFAVFDEPTMATLMASMKAHGVKSFLLVTGPDDIPDSRPAFVLQSAVKGFDVAVHRYPVAAP